MNKRWFYAAFVLVSTVVYAKEQPLPLPESTAADLHGKSVVVTRHARPSFTAMTPGKAAFGLIGAATMISAGNKLVDENHVEDPAGVIERALVPALVARYGLQWDPLETSVIDVEKPKDIAAAKPGVDYVLDVRSGGWGFSYYPGEFSAAWVMYSVQVQLINAKSGAPVANMACNANTRGHSARPQRAALVDDGARLLKDVTAALGWTCVELLAKEEFHLTAEETPAIPPALVDPLAAYAAAHPSAAQEQPAQANTGSKTLR